MRDPFRRRTRPEGHEPGRCRAFKDDDDLLVRIFGTGEEIRVVDQFDAALPGAGLEIVFFLGSDGTTRATLDDLGWMDNQGNSHDYFVA